MRWFRWSIAILTLATACSGNDRSGETDASVTDSSGSGETTDSGDAANDEATDASNDREANDAGTEIDARMDDALRDSGFAERDAECRDARDAGCSICGNYRIEPGETCDPPNLKTCSTNCQAHNCGDGIVEPGESCDPPNDVNCSASCTLSACGNLIVEPGETCDPPDNRHCSSTCQASLCGNGIVEIGEACEPPGQGGCSWGCQNTCGNGVLDPGETCDPPNGVNCSEDCRAHTCGNGLMEASETCDPPDAHCGPDCRLIPGQGCPNVINNALQTAVSCTSDERYLVNECGDNCAQITPDVCLRCERWYQILNSRDCEILEGNAQAGPSLGTPRSVLCRRAVECMRRTNCGARWGGYDCYCGNAADSSCATGGADGPCKAALEAAFESTRPAEILGHGNDITFAGVVAVNRVSEDLSLCPAACFGTCGNGVVEPGESCDPPNDTTCSPNCVAHVCGNGILEPGEICDPPNSTDCTSNCRPSVCGNGAVEPGEECDPPNGGNCSGGCHICGNGVIESGEDCDPPNDIACNPGCRLSLCGDGVVSVGEDCDPPNDTDCSRDCRRHQCGNGRIEPTENCDPPNTVDCSFDCRSHSCGNGVMESSETCDPPNGSTCGTDCRLIPNHGCPNVVDTVRQGSVSCTVAERYLVNNCGENCAPITADTCLRCERAMDEDGVLDCDHASGLASGGPLAGTPRAALCRMALECMRRTRCAADLRGVDFPCYCGSTLPWLCQTTGADGACKDIIEASLETSDPQELFERRYDSTYGGGIAWQRMVRDGACNNACFGSCGNGKVEAGEECDPPNDADCNANCHRHTCGNGIIEPPELCDPPDDVFCSSTCQRRPE